MARVGNGESVINDLYTMIAELTSSGWDVYSPMVRSLVARNDWAQQAEGEQRLFRALKHRSFALLWCGQTISRVGDFLYQIALAWWVLEKTGSAAIMATVLVFSFAPTVLFLLLGGVLVDRLPRVPVMLTSDVLRGVVVLAVAALASAQRLEIWHVYGASLVFGFVDAFFSPAYAAIVPEVTPPESLPSANSLSSISTQAGRIVGPLIGAALVALGGTPVAFAVNGPSFFVSAGCLIPLVGRSFAPANRGGTASILEDLREGIATVLGSAWLWITILVAALLNVTLVGPYTVALPFLAKQHLQTDVRLLGLLYAMFPVGYLVGNLWLGRATRLRARGRLAYGGLIVAGLMMLGIGLPLPIPLLALAALLNGAGLEVFGLIWTNTLQELVPGERLGRVSSIDLLGSTALMPVGLALTGWATDAVGAALVCVIGGGLTVLFAGLGLTHRSVRALD